MKRYAVWFFLLLFSSVTLLVAGLMSWTTPAQAQCGSQASSCKSCHETQGEMPVNTNGEWHKAHAFGDFCEFCHAGNVQATDKDEAHMGLAEPLGDVKASCQSCHPDNYMEQAEIYAVALGVSLDAGDGSGSSNTAGDDTGGDTAIGATAISAPLGGEEIDFNLLYVEAVTPQPLISNWSNVILLLLILGVGGAFFVTAWTWEGWGPKIAGWIDVNVSPIPRTLVAASARGNTGAMLAQSLANKNEAEVQALLNQNPKLQHLLPKLMNCQPETLAALDTILANPERGGEILSVISKVDVEVVSALRKVGAKDRDLLLALVKEM